jgi:hypothetical protein
MVSVPALNGAIPDQVYDATMPADPRFILISNDCYPWFGSVPLLASYVGEYDITYVFANTTTIAHGQAIDGVMDPPDHSVYVAVPCPVDTYNDRCAHYHKYTAIGLLPTPTVHNQILPASQQPRCTPCPPGGYHTGGKTGAWFCLPPSGKTALLTPLPGNPTSSALRGLLNMFVGPLSSSASSSSNMSTLWSRRDILGYQWECGTKPEHCYQCADVPGMQGKLPHEFNQEMILRHLFVWQVRTTHTHTPPLPPN